MKYTVIILVVLVLLLSLFKIDKEDPRLFKHGKSTLNLEIADSDKERELGLSGRESLASTTGLLFVFETPGRYGFWMKDMKFPIDMAWIDESKRVVYIENNVRPDTFPKVFTPTSTAQYVLETNAGFFEQSKIKIGDIVEF